jgi:hypothetical protein
MSSYFSNRTSDRRIHKPAADQSRGSSAFGADPRQSVETLSATYSSRAKVRGHALAIKRDLYTLWKFEIALRIQ